MNDEPMNINFNLFLKKYHTNSAVNKVGRTYFHALLNSSSKSPIGDSTK